MQFNLVFIKEKMKEMKLTNKEMAERLGVHINTFQRKITGKRDFNSEEIAKLIEVLKVKPKDLFKK